MARDPLDAQDPDECRETVTRLFDSGDYRVLVVTTSGATIVGSLPRPSVVWHSRDDTVHNLGSEQCFSANRLVLDNEGEPFREQTIYVPIKAVATVLAAPIVQPTESTNWTDDRQSVFQTAFDRSVDIARSAGFDVERELRMYHLEATRSIEWGPVRFLHDTPLYCDWAYFSQRSGGLRSAGVGFVVSG